ncbi:olfactory receptor 6M1-like, partial [Apteryx mantelli]|uniref:Olfactory receptor n=1 Tax=Apteryx mantelli TaxID=2696672 RepID=A0ABM4G866_9AVES
LVILVGNLLIIALILSDRDLHRPMYFFLCNLSSLEIFITTSIIPKTVASLLMGNKTISYPFCLTQCYFYSLLGNIEFVLLAVMSYDRYVAICYPLRYPMLMNSQFCVQLLLGSWTAGFLATIVPTILVVRLPFCNANRIDHFFCDIVLLIKLSCADTRTVELVSFMNASLILFGSLIMSAMSYIYIINTILRLPSASSQNKAFSTCSSHFTFVILAYGSCIFLYVQPSTHKISYNKIVSLLNTMITPLMSPFIFSLRNEQMKKALKVGLILAVVLRIPSEQGRHKAFSMCLPHLAVVSVFVSTIMFSHLKTPSMSSPAQDLVFGVLYVVVPPTLNPLLYSLRNKELKEALKKLIPLGQCQHP